MNYAKHYQKLIERAPKIKPKSEYRERHRILPGCLGGKYTKNNVAYLTPEEHYLAHQLLVKLHPNNPKLIHAVVAMTVSNGIHDRSMNKLYGWARRKHAESVSERMKGHHYGLGVPKSEKTKRRMSESAKCNTRTTEHQENLTTSIKQGFAEGRIAWNKGTTGTSNVESIIKTWQITKPNGEIVIVKNLSKFCRDNGLTPELYQAAKTGGTHYGYRCKQIAT